MNFEDLKVVWDGQNEAPLYAIDETGLRKQIEESSDAFNRSIFWRDVREMGIGLVVGILMFVLSAQMIFGDENWLTQFFQVEANGSNAGLLILSGIIWFHSVAYRFMGRRRQEQREQQFDGSLIGDLQKACSQVDFQVWLATRVVWWGTLPVFFATGLLLFVLAKSDLESRWADDPVGAILFFCFMVVVMSVSFVLDYYCKKKPIQDELLPRKRELEALQNKLRESETKSA